MKTVLVLLLGLALLGCATPEKGNPHMEGADDQAIRQWFDQWIQATTEGDLELARSLIDHDAVFLVPGAGRMDKESFAAAATASDPNTEFELDCSIQEIEVIGDHAWLSTKLSLVMTDKGTGSRSLMAGDSLSLLKRRGAGWVVIRDANTLVPVPPETEGD
jgi:uncharacterized protein (TIGR02246 family)